MSFCVIKLWRHQAFYEEDPTNFQEMLHGIEHLEQIIESMQVVMTSNHALLSNRLYHHQQLPFERAHSANDHSTPISQSVNTPLTITEEHITNGVEQRRTAGQAQIGRVIDSISLCCEKSRWKLQLKLPSTFIYW